MYLQDVKILTEFPHLDILTLENLPLVNDLLPLSFCIKLTDLTLADLGSVTDFLPISSLNQLTKLRLSDLKSLRSLSQIFQGHLFKLNTLTLSGLSVSLSPIAYLENLTTLHLSNMYISSLEPLVQLPKLQKIYLDKISFSGKWEDLAQIPSLTNIYLGQGIYDGDLPKKLWGKIQSS